MVLPVNRTARQRGHRGRAGRSLPSHPHPGVQTSRESRSRVAQGLGAVPASRWGILLVLGLKLCTPSCMLRLKGLVLEFPASRTFSQNWDAVQGSLSEPPSVAPPCRHLAVLRLQGVPRHSPTLARGCHPSWTGRTGPVCPPSLPSTSASGEGQLWPPSPLG